MSETATRFIEQPAYKEFACYDCRVKQPVDSPRIFDNLRKGINDRAVSICKSCAQKAAEGAGQEIQKQKSPSANTGGLLATSAANQGTPNYSNSAINKTNELLEELIRLTQLSLEHQGINTAKPVVQWYEQTDSQPKAWAEIQLEMSKELKEFAYQFEPQIQQNHITLHLKEMMRGSTAWIKAAREREPELARIARANWGVATCTFEY